MPEAAALHKVCFSDEPSGRRYRYWLEARVESTSEQIDNRICLFLMLNPNKAGKERSDATVERCKYLACAWGYHILWICNLLPVRRGDSNALPVLPEERMGPYRPESAAFAGCALCRSDSNDDLDINDLHVMEAAHQASRIVCAWGGEGSKTGRSRDVIRKLIDAGHERKLHTLGFTANEPRHAKPRRVEQWPKPDDLTQWSGVRAWLAAKR